MYTDLLARIKNAERAKKEAFTAPYSKMDFAVAQALVHANYLKSADKKIIAKKNFIEVKLKHGDDGPAVTDFKIISKRSRRIYIGWREIRPVRGGFGVSMISTPSGVMSGRKARKEKLGGEYLFEIW